MTDEAKALVERLRHFDYNVDIATFYDEDPECVSEAADLIETQARENAAKDAEIERLRGALRWYEKQANDCRKITREGDDARYALDRDGGERARAALAGDSHDQ